MSAAPIAEQTQQGKLLALLGGLHYLLTKCDETHLPTPHLLRQIKDQFRDIYELAKVPDRDIQRAGFIMMALSQSTRVEQIRIPGGWREDVIILEPILYRWAVLASHQATTPVPTPKAANGNGEQH